MKLLNRDIIPYGMLTLRELDSRRIADFLTFSIWLHSFVDFFFCPQIHQPLDPITKQRKGIAYITFAQISNAIAAYEALDKKSFQGRLLHILGAVDRSGKVEVETKKNLKDEKAAKRKLAAGKDFNWSMLYMNVGLCVSFLYFPYLKTNRATRWHLRLLHVWTLKNQKFWTQSRVTTQL